MRKAFNVNINDLNMIFGATSYSEASLTNCTYFVQIGDENATFISEDGMIDFYMYASALGIKQVKMVKLNGGVYIEGTIVVKADDHITTKQTSSVIFEDTGAGGNLASAYNKYTQDIYDQSLVIYGSMLGGMKSFLSKKVIFRMKNIIDKVSNILPFSGYLIKTDPLVLAGDIITTVTTTTVRIGSFSKVYPKKTNWVYSRTQKTLIREW